MKLDDALADIDVMAIAEAVGVVRHPADLVETPAAPHPVIGRPKVRIVATSPSDLTASCHHCDWTYSNSVKSDVEYMATQHRAQHRAGRTGAVR